MKSQIKEDPRVKAALEQVLQNGEVGIQVAAYLNGELIVDSAAGYADVETKKPVDEKTLFCPFSTTKGVIATCVHILAEQGFVDYKAPVAKYWPEFAQNGKDKITVQQALDHQAGLPWMPEGVTAELQADWNWMIKQLEKMEPAFEPGTNAYHGITWGWIVGEIVHRADPKHRTIDRFLKEEVMNPMGIEDMYLGLPESEEPRVAKLLGADAPEEEPLPNYYLGMPLSVYPGPSVYNTRLAHKTVNPSGGLLTSARSLARVFAMYACKGTLDGKQYLSQEHVYSLFNPRPHTEVTDKYLGCALAAGNGLYLAGDDGGFTGMVPGVIPKYRSIIWSNGAGGSVAWGELDTGLSVAITHNRMHSLGDNGGEIYGPVVKVIRQIANELNEKA